MIEILNRSWPFLRLQNSGKGVKNSNEHPESYDEPDRGRSFGGVLNHLANVAQRSTPSKGLRMAQGR